MTETKKEIGKRLRRIRNIFLEGGKVSARQFADALGETKDNIANYENGRAHIPNRLLIALYERGFNPIYILSGEGSLFATNTQGRALMEIFDLKKMQKRRNESSNDNDFSKFSIRDLERKVYQFQVAAGDIMKIIEKKKQEDL